MRSLSIYLFSVNPQNYPIFKANKPALLEYLGMDFFVLVNPGSDRYVFCTTVPKHESGPGAVFVDL